MARHDRERTAFTLIELLVVIAIISILAALLATAVAKYFAVGQTMATETTIRKAYSKLLVQWETVITAARQENMDNMFTFNNNDATVGIRNIANGDENRTRVIYIKLRLMQEFPMNYAEAVTPSFTDTNGYTWSLPPKQSFANLPSSIQYSPYESSVCLTASLRQARNGINLSADDLGSSVKTLNAGSVSVPYLVDGWGTPLAFFRWATGCRNAELDGLYPGTSTVIRDLQDTDGTLMNNTWWSGSANSGTLFRTAFENSLHSLHQPPPGTAAPLPPTTPYAYYNVPVIASAGPNLQFGFNTIANPANSTQTRLDPSMSPDTTYNDFDNIYSFRLVRPGAGTQGN